MTQIGQAPPDRVVVPVVDVVLELVDLLVHVVDHVEVALGHVVDDVIRHHPRRRVALARFRDSRQVERCAVGRSLAHGQHVLVREQDVDLAVVHAVFVLDHDRHQQHRKGVRAVALDLGARLVRVRMGFEQRLQRLRMQVRRPCSVEFVLGRAAYGGAKQLFSGELRPTPPNAAPPRAG